MANEGIAQMQMEAAEADPPLPVIDNVHDPSPQTYIPPVRSQMDTVIPDATPLAAPQAHSTVSIPTIAPRTATPSRPVNGAMESTTPMPAKAASHGAPARRYLNEKVTGVLLEGMKRLAAEQPEMPLRVLGEFLLQKSGELEGKAT